MATGNKVGDREAATEKIRKEIWKRGADIAQAPPGDCVDPAKAERRLDLGPEIPSANHPEAHHESGAENHNANEGSPRHCRAVACYICDSSNLGRVFDPEEVGDVNLQRHDHDQGPAL
jgi:hypothetical protein